MAAQSAADASNEAIDHAREAADRDFRPWLTIEATLDSRVDLDPIEKGYISLFIRLRCTNVGREAGQNVVYLVRGVDLSIKQDLEGWFEQLVNGAIDRSKMTRPYDGKIWGEGDIHGDSLAPSESHVNKRWCLVPGSEGENDLRWYGTPETHICKLCVGIAVAYTSATSPAGTFCTARVLPIGIPDIPEFLDIIRLRDLPIGTGRAALGPARKAQTS